MMPKELPGFVNAHTHMYSGLVPLGMPEPAVRPADFQEILKKIWWRLDRALDERSLAAAARYYIAHALLAGTTTLVDHHESPEFINGSLNLLADACQDLGIRAVLCYGATERNGGRDEGIKSTMESWLFIGSNRRPLVLGVFGLHASFTLSNHTIEEVGEACHAFNVPLHVHMAEDQIDVRDACTRGFDGPLGRLIALDALPPGSILAHGVHLPAAHVRRAAEAGAWIVQNPRSNRGNRVGYPAALAESPKVALGTDGYPSDLRAEAEVLRREAAEHGENPSVAETRLSAGSELVRELFARRRSTRAGEAPVSPGAGPDDDRIVIEDSRVIEVRIGGRVVVSEGRLLTGDIEEIDARAREEAARLWKRMESVQET